MLPHLIFFLLASLTAPVATLDFPAKVQVDLIFPKNETYAPTGYFPMVFAVRNFQVAKPLEFDVYGSIKNHREYTYQLDDATLGVDYDYWRFPGRYQGFRLWRESRDADPIFFINSITNITNGTDTRFHVGWRVDMDNCTEPDDLDIPVRENSRGNVLFRSEEQRLEFSVAPDGKVPDIEEAIRSCNFQSLAIDVHGTDYGRIGHQCGDIRRASPDKQCDILTDYAEEVATNVSDRVLARLGCEEGIWQDMREDCADFAARFGQQSGWVALGMGVLTSLFII